MKPIDPADLAKSWPERQRLWARELGRLQIGVESIAEQVAKYRRVTVAITIVAGGIGAMILAIFLAFRAPKAGLIVSVGLLGPVIFSAWIGQWRSEARAAAYLREKALVEGASKPSGQTNDPELA